jgi:hypothetical protein
VRSRAAVSAGGRGSAWFVSSGGGPAPTAGTRRIPPRLSGNPAGVAGLSCATPRNVRMGARMRCRGDERAWDTGFMSVWPAREDRAFAVSFTAEDIAVILVWAGEGLTTPAGLLMRRLARKARPDNYVLRRVTSSRNQLAYFKTGRMSRTRAGARAGRVKTLPVLRPLACGSTIPNVIERTVGRRKPAPESRSRELQRD